MKSCPIFIFMHCYTNNLMTHACVQQDPFTLLLARDIPGILLFKVSATLTVANYCSCIA